MQKGIQLFNKLNNEDQNLHEAKKSRRGRSETLVTNRNECIIYRYYYYSKIIKLRYEDTLNAVSNEFFLASRTIINTLEANAELASRVFKEKKDIKQLEKKFNFLNWKVK